MDMVVDMLDAKAVIAVTAGTITELQFRVFGVGFTANRAFVPVLAAVVCASFGFFCGLPEVYRVWRSARTERPQEKHQFFAAYDKEV